MQQSSTQQNRMAAGFMPHGKQFGYIFLGNIDKGKEYRVVAHELGHGQWKLIHSFDDCYGEEVAVTRGKTDNLMDYNDGTHIAKWQWDILQEPAVFDGVFDSDEDKMAAADKKETTTPKPKPGDPLVEMRIVHTNSAPLSGGMFGCARVGTDDCSRLSQTLSNLPKYGDKTKVHDGIDLYANVATDVYSMYDGEVVFVENSVSPNIEGNAGPLGNRVVVKYTPQQHGNKGTRKTIYVSYAHLNSVDGTIQVNSKVSVGQVIGKSGCTGNADYLASKSNAQRQHLHLTVYEGSFANKNRVAPRTYITTKFDDNGNKIK